eukprot:TRINITY_DN2220_c0_g1_i1.p1 TRINITY_DN2220_c0_g1~~TRINITY_DN2220_c0_g1_i1.p1  ORF type:complete len:168 (+),score=17.83 TRINITY_DN2220_c0_g1_i1:64-504(+)
MGSSLGNRLGEGPEAAAPAAAGAPSRSSPASARAFCRRISAISSIFALRSASYVRLASSSSSFLRFSSSSRFFFSSARFRARSSSSSSSRWAADCPSRLALSARSASSSSRVGHRHGLRQPLPGPSAGASRRSRPSLPCARPHMSA